MINVSNSFKEELNNDNRDYMCYVDIVLVNPGDVVESYLQDSSGEYILDSSGENINTFFDGVVISLTNENLWSSALSIEESVSNQNSFDIGSVIINKATIVINNIYEDYTSYDFTGAKVTIRIGLQLSNGTIEVVNKGIFYVDSATYNGSLITLECLDSMSKFDKDYSESTLTYPATLRQIVQNACSVCDVLYSAATFENDTFIVNERPSDESLTFRQMLNYVGQIACQQFSIDHNDRLIARWYDRDMMDDLYSSPSSVDDSEYHQISSINSQNINQDDVIITGVKVTEFSESTENPGGSYLSGTTGYVIEIKDNKLIPIGKGSGVSTYLGQKLVGMRFRPMELTFQNDPTIEPTDIAEVIDFKGNHFYTFITSTNFTVGNTQTLSCGAESPIRNSASRYSAATQAYTNSKKLVEKEKTERELAVEALNNALSNASGMYTTEEQQSDGSVITYLHDKPTLEESQNVIMITAEAIGISNDGGETYPYGLFLTGDLIARLLYVVGINADYINSGAITVADNDGEITFFADTETGRVDIKAYSLTITGKTVEEIANEESETVLNDFVGSVYTPTITNLQNQIDGQIETYYEDYEPSLQNYPANEWTTTEERQKHEGDLFFWKSKGYAYRFFQDGATWKWQMVQDTDITSALAAAEKAQDTADGKRRVFVVTPQPPYDIGDLWCNGEDILTCSTARPQGSLYVSSDWEKLNSYTDDTLANEALEEARQARNLNIILDNEYQGIPADYEGNIGTFPEVKTFVQVLYGHTDVSTDCIYAITKSNSVTGSWDNATRTYTVTGLSEDTGWVDITASYLSLFTTTKRFNVQKVKDGEPGEDGPPGAAGAPGRTYTIEPSVNVLKRASDNSIAPNFIEFNAYYRDGNSATRTAYAGRWIIEETADGDEWTTIYTSSANENSVTHYLYSMLADSDGSAIANANGDTIGIPRDIVAIRAKLYAAGGTTNLLDMQSVAVVIDVDNLTHEEIFNLLTNNGAIQGIYQEGNQIYINAEYIQAGTMSADRIYGGTLSLGGANNSGGVFNLYDENGTLKSVMDNDGFNFWDGENFVGSIRTRYMEEYERGCCAICADNVSVIALSSNYIFDNDPDSKVFNSDIYMTNTGFFVGDQYKLPGVHFPRYVYFENDIQIGQHGRISEDALTSNRLLDISVSPGDDIWIGANNNEFGDTEVRIYGDLQQMRDPSNPSDERLKTKITPFSESAINIINDIQIYGYTWIESGKSEKAGFIAQQLESDVSADLTRIGKDGVHNVKPTKMIPYLVKAVQELSEEIELLKKEICDLKGENYTPKEHKKDKWKPSDMSLEEKREFIESLKRAERKK